ncbi:MAG: nuclear transport factor 2 family protein [Spongiibacteraceae bacterium]
MPDREQIIVENQMGNPIIERFKCSYQDMLQMDLSQLDQLYAKNIIFKDPVHEIKGLAILQDYMADLSGNLLECRFEYLDELLSNREAYIKWNMHFRHPRLAAGKLLTVRGVSQLNFDKKIYYHEDFYDLGAMLYEHVPVVGGMTRWLKRRLKI